MTLDIRPLDSRDAEAYRALRLRALLAHSDAFASSPEEESAWPMDRFESMLGTQTDGAVFGAFREGLLVALAGIHRESMKKLAHKAVLWGVYVAPEARGLRVGEQVIRRALRHAVEALGVRQVNLGVNTRNEAALRLYREMGFTVYGTERGYLLVDGVLHDEFQMAWVAGADDSAQRARGHHHRHFDLMRCFPDTIRAAGSEVATYLSEEPVRARTGATFVVSGTMLEYPSRLYLPLRVMDDALHEFEGERRQVALCLATRHHDGFFRESCLRRLGVPRMPWMLPFVFILLGELVDEVASLAARLLEEAPREMVLGFAGTNTERMHTLRRRAISYWDCYYRGRYAHYRDVPAVRLLDKLGI